MSTEPPADKALDPQRYRESNEIVPDARLLSAELGIQLFSRSRLATYTYNCEVATATGVAAEEWQFDIPSDLSDVKQVRAWDATGGLQHNLIRGDGKGSRLTVTFRNRVVSGASYKFSYEYVMPTTSVNAKGILSETTAFLGWSIFLMHCNVLVINVTLPKRATPIETVPAPKQQFDDGGTIRLRYEGGNLRALESYLLLIGYRHTRIGMPAFLWLAGAIGTGFVGAVVAAALGLN